jgi:hypothetical protein
MSLTPQEETMTNAVTNIRTSPANTRRQEREATVNAKVNELFESFDCYTILHAVANRLEKYGKEAERTREGFKMTQLRRKEIEAEVFAIRQTARALKN